MKHKRSNYKYFLAVLAGMGASLLCATTIFAVEIELVKVNARDGNGYFHAPPLFDTEGMDYGDALEYKRKMWDLIPIEPLVTRYGEKWKRVTDSASRSDTLTYILYFQHVTRYLHTPPAGCKGVKVGDQFRFDEIRCEYSFGALTYELQEIEDYWAIRELCEDGVLYAYSAPLAQIDAHPFEKDRYALVSDTPISQMKLILRENDMVSRDIFPYRHVVWELDLGDGVERWLVYVDAYTEGLDTVLVTNPSNKQRRVVQHVTYMYPNC